VTRPPTQSGNATRVTGTPVRRAPSGSTGTDYTQNAPKTGGQQIKRLATLRGCCAKTKELRAEQLNGFQTHPTSTAAYG